MAELTESTPNTTDYDYDELPESNYCYMGDISELSALLISILYSVIFLFSLLGNSLVLRIVLKYESLMSLTNLFIVNLCISDLIFSCTLPFLIVYHSYGWIMGEFLCKAVSGIFSISYFCGVIFLTIMTILRYLAVVDPLSTLRTQKKRSGILVSLAVWVTSLLFVIPEILSIQVTTDIDGRYGCYYQAFYPWEMVELCLKVLFFLISFMIIAICYTGMLDILLRSRSQSRHRTVRLIFAIVLVFFLSWAPYNVLGFVYALSEQNVIESKCQTKKDIYFAFDISRTVAYCHCCLNPVLYVFVGVKFRRHLKLLYKQYAQRHRAILPSSPRHHSSHADLYEEQSLY
ncbi:chemokine XC receptor 1 [Anolis carolinensis]|uniref:X-C motif chemokine receptor 1 n=1 Tax=Anolis carolinensis TaxID=28377 RepID=H9GKN9_ANOCA|nr:PREDICTED: chemokine XC receptor 1 [Anolis carolinensis]|eukprot:XP_016851955.1 PREDICTED: chemokine XC receptor 1 [Anolis carolinensis]